MRICAVLGAGASYANALYFRPLRMQNTHPPLDGTFFQTVDARNIALSAPLRRYMREVMGLAPNLSALKGMRMEEFFRDVFYDFQETPSDRRALDAYIDLIDLYLRVLRETTNWLADDGRTGAPVGRLLASAADPGDELDVVTFNHDLVIENEIIRRAKLRERWCLDQGYGAFGARLSLTRPTSNLPLFNIHQDGVCDHARAIRIHKLHGSLNWIVRINSTRPTAGVLGGAGNRTIHLSPKRKISGREVFVRVGQGRTQWQTWPVVVPPVYAKQALRNAVHDVWDEAASALEAADRVVVFGYSLPAIDIEAEKLLERGLAKSSLPWIDVINPDPASAARYASLAGSSPIRWYPSVASFLAAGAFQ